MSREETEQILKELVTEQYQIVENIRSNEESMKSKIQRMAVIMEQRLELLDSSMSIQFVSEISSEITRILRENNIATASCVYQYLDDKYKNPELSKWGKIGSQVSDLGQVGLGQRIEECSSVSELGTQLSQTKIAKNNYDRMGSILSNRIDTIRARLYQLGVKQMDDEKYRRPISIHDFKHFVPDDEELHRINEGVVYWIRQQAKALEDIAKLYEEFPATDLEHAKQYFNANKMLATLYTSVKDVKWSGDLSFWFDRNYWANAQSAHDSGNSTKFDSNLCAYCSRDIDIDPDDYHVMVYDKTSPSGYRCDNCNGTAVFNRETTREQVTDRKPEIERMARDVINHLPYYPEFFSHFRLTYIRDKIMARKLNISERFSVASIAGKEEIVVNPDLLSPKK